ncbi:LptA/OstA family protein [Candidatus Atelocyanobacterium thalassae]|uniref:Organic solvent tolerance-like N-terminal domain-containing protein n=2 Tax=Candidatus Atelocyanobacterium thalassae TaxID=713887 RepID=A0A086CI28_9CHRO|nr:LptA/OstA family protein [Candidatus Atelocyanobacterium thalassa]KFF41842.1 MAG: hypothetical protein ucyna2_00220 [Candidatus Atelocyanobacterium thalassa isolate SIO64986]BDA40328.1 LPS-assembly protein LptD [cyanobacterium endosymbiont of Braarudosphaera bigelowii]
MFSTSTILTKYVLKALRLTLPIVISIFTIKVSEDKAFAQTSALPTTLTVRSDIQEANSETGTVTARGNVQFFYPARKLQGTAAQAQYFSRERRLVLTGNVYILENGNSIRSESMVYLMDEGRFIATPEPTQQVESIYLVAPDSETAPY